MHVCVIVAMLCLHLSVFCLISAKICSIISRFLLFRVSSNTWLKPVRLKKVPHHESVWNLSYSMSSVQQLLQPVLSKDINRRSATRKNDQKMCGELFLAPPRTTFKLYQRFLRAVYLRCVFNHNLDSAGSISSFAFPPHTQAVNTKYDQSLENVP